MAPNAKLAENAKGIYCKMLKEEFGDAVRFGPITVEDDGDRDGQPKLAVVIVFEHPEGALDTDKAMAAMAQAEAALLEIGISPAPRWVFVPEREYPNHLRERPRN